MGVSLPCGSAGQGLTLAKFGITEHLYLVCKYDYNSVTFLQKSWTPYGQLSLKLMPSL